MDFGKTGLLLVTAWVVAYLGGRLAKRPMPWFFWVLGGAGCFLFAFHGGSRPTTWLVLGALCLAVGGFAWLVSPERRGQGSEAQLGEEDLEPIRSLVDAIEGGGVRDPQAAYAGEAQGFRISVGIAVVSGALALAAFVWVRTHITGEVGFGGIAFLAAIALPLVISLVFLLVAVRSLWRMRGLRRRMALEARAAPAAVSSPVARETDLSAGG